MAERLEFAHRQRGSASRRSALGMALLLIGVAVALLTRPLWTPRVPPGVLIEVVGEVPRPGVHNLEAPTVARAVAAAGGAATGLPETPLYAGDRVIVSPEGVRVAPGGDPLLVGLPVDLNTADAPALEALPGIGPSLARAILDDRAQRGPFPRVESLARVKGVGPATTTELAPFLSVSGVDDLEPPGPLDVNRASAAALETLPGIGPVMAARIVVDREDRGAFRSVDDLDRVRGVGPATVARLRERMVALPLEGGGEAGAPQDVGEDHQGSLDLVERGVGAD
jgi:competence ComEA-like helix-hairpin-helix protein